MVFRLRVTESRPTRIAIAVCLWAAAGAAWWYWHTFARAPASAKIKAHERQAVGAYTVGTFPTKGGSIQVINVVSPDATFDDLLERRRCFVWRDSATGASSMSCDGAGFPN